MLSPSVRVARFDSDAAPRLVVSLARTDHEVEEAQRLRYQVFAEEMGARLAGPQGIDRDIFDRFCDHLLVRDERSNEVVGTYRILSPDGAEAIGSYYSETEFNLTRLRHLRHRMVEVGRSCVHPDYRTGGVIQMLWSGLGRYMAEHGHDLLVGCASIGMQDGGHSAAGIYNILRAINPCPPEYRVFPRCPLPLASLTEATEVRLPPLIKGYLRLGAWVCGEPAWDPDFNTADLLLLLPLSRMEPRHARRFLRR